MSRWVAQLFDSVARRNQDAAPLDQHGANRHLAARAGTFGLDEGKTHEPPLTH
jgi:hypothetical protein